MNVVFASHTWGVRRGMGGRCCLRCGNMGSESEGASLDDLLARGLKTPELVIMDGGKGLEAALAAV